MMAHFAELDENNVVLRVIVTHVQAIEAAPFPESETLGINFCKNTYGKNTNWRQTSYNANFRKNYASVGGSYNLELDAFIAPKPYPSWVLNIETGHWEAPILQPTDGNEYYWDELTQSWVIVIVPDSQIQV